MVWLIDYGAGNVRSVRNAIRRLGYDVQDVSKPEDIMAADKLIFLGVGSFGSAMNSLYRSGFVEPLKRYIAEGRPYLGICLGLQTLFEGSDESPSIQGLGVIKGHCRRFDSSRLSVPHIGWNGVNQVKGSMLFSGYGGDKLYFVHSFHPIPEGDGRNWVLTTTDYGNEFVSGVQKGGVVAVQFHPEKSGEAGLRILGNFLRLNDLATEKYRQPAGWTKLAKRIVACLDVRTNDEGDLVVTKGHKYNVRENGRVRNFGEPVNLARRYFEEGADEICFLNITAFRQEPLEDIPMLEVLRQTSGNVFVPLTIGGGIREYDATNGRHYTSLDVASEYFRSGADKISIGGDAVKATENLLATRKKTGATSIEQISDVYGKQAVVVSVDPKRVYVRSPRETKHRVIRTELPGPNGEEYCWFQCTVHGGRETRDIDALELAESAAELGAGELLLNSIDRDGTNRGYDLELIRAVSDAVDIPMIASSGAGCPEHFYDVFSQTDAEAALAAGIFHRREVPIQVVKEHLRSRNIEVR